MNRDGSAEPASRDQILRREQEQGNIHFPCSVDQYLDWQPYPVDPYSAISDDHTYIHTMACNDLLPHYIYNILTTSIYMEQRFLFLLFGCTYTTNNVSSV